MGIPRSPGPRARARRALARKVVLDRAPVNPSPHPCATTRHVERHLGAVRDGCCRPGPDRRTGTSGYWVTNGSKRARSSPGDPDVPVRRSPGGAPPSLTAPRWRSTCRVVARGCGEGFTVPRSRTTFPASGLRARARGPGERGSPCTHTAPVSSVPILVAALSAPRALQASARERPNSVRGTPASGPPLLPAGDGRLIAHTATCRCPMTRRRSAQRDGDRDRPGPPRTCPPSTWTWTG